MDLTKTVNVKNRGISRVVYMTPDNLITRGFAPGEIKRNISVKELEELTYTPGGKSLLQKYLVINDKEVCEYLGLTIEPEYFYDEEDIRKLLLTGSLDELLDCLEFAPEGVIELVKKFAVDLKINDIQKRDAIKNSVRTGRFDVTAAISNVEYANSTEDGEVVESSTPKRRVQPKPQAPVTYNRVK